MRHRWTTAIPGSAVVIAMSAGLVGVPGCAAGGLNVTTGAPPTVVCGTVLNDSAAGAVVYDATRQLPVVKYSTVGDLLIFRVSRGCDQGTHVTWTPPSAAHLVKAAYARDGQMAAVVLKPTTPRAAFRLIAKRDDRVKAAATVRLAP